MQDNGYGVQDLVEDFSELKSNGQYTQMGLHAAILVVLAPVSLLVICIKYVLYVFGRIVAVAVPDQPNDETGDCDRKRGEK